MNLLEKLAAYDSPTDTERSYDVGYQKGTYMLANLVIQEARTGAVELTSRVQHQLDRVLNADDRSTPYAQGYLAGRREIVKLLEDNGILQTTNS